MGLKLVGLMLVVMAVVGSIFYWYYTDTQEKMAILHENNAKLETAVSTQKDAIDSYKKDIVKVMAEKNKVEEKFADSRKSVDNLRNKFNKQSKLLGARDIGKLGAAKPRIISKIVTKGSNDAIRCVEIISGSPLTKKERNATKPSKINKACPKLANPNYLGQ